MSSKREAPAPPRINLSPFRALRETSPELSIEPHYMVRIVPINIKWVWDSAKTSLIIDMSWAQALINCGATARELEDLRSRLHVALMLLHSNIDKEFMRAHVGRELGDATLADFNLRTVEQNAERALAGSPTWKDLILHALGLVGYVVPSTTKH